jgi:tetratricopeptide (TPR) repeat protein
MTHEEIPPAIKEAIRHQSLIFFVGSGYSQNLALPNWIGLVRRFVDELAKKDALLSALQTEAAQDTAVPVKILDALLKKGYKADCQQILGDIIDIDLSGYDLQNQERIWKITQTVITTNFDRGLESAMDDSWKEELEVFTGSKSFGVSILKDLRYLFKIHGCISDPANCILFSDDYDQLYKYNHRFLLQLKRVCANATLVFVGYSVGDVEVQQILENVHALFHTGTQHFILTTGKSNFEQFGINTISLASYQEVAPYLDMLAAYRAKIDGELQAITEKVRRQYNGRSDLMDLFERDNKIYQEKDAFLKGEDRKDILRLGKLNGLDKRENQSMISQLTGAGMEEQLKDYLLLTRTAMRYNNEAYFEHLEGGYVKTRAKLALADYTAALTIGRHLFGGVNDEIINLYNEIGGCYLYLNDDQQAEHYYREGLRLSLDAGLKENKMLTGSFYNNLGNLAVLRGDLEGAIDFYREALHKKKEIGGAPAGEMRNMAAILIKLKKYEDAIEMYSQVIRSGKAPVLIRAGDCHGIGLAHARLNQNEEAIKYYRRAAALFFNYYGKENKEFLLLYNDIGYYYSLCKEYKKAIVYYKKVIALETNEENKFIAMNNMGNAYFDVADFKKAKKVFENSIAILKKNHITEADYPEGYAYCNSKIALAAAQLQAR